MSEIAVEQLGGFVGPGGPGAHVHTRGSVAWSALSAEDQRAVDAAFAAGAHDPLNANLYYRLSRKVGDAAQTVYVKPEQVPMALQASVKTELN